MPNHSPEPLYGSRSEAEETDKPPQVYDTVQDPESVGDPCQEDILREGASRVRGPANERVSSAQES